MSATQAIANRLDSGRTTEKNHPSGGQGWNELGTSGLKVVRSHRLAQSQNSRPNLLKFSMSYSFSLNTVEPPLSGLYQATSNKSPEIYVEKK